MVQAEEVEEDNLNFNKNATINKVDVNLVERFSLSDSIY